MSSGRGWDIIRDRTHDSVPFLLCHRNGVLSLPLRNVTLWVTVILNVYVCCPNIGSDPLRLFNTTWVKIFYLTSFPVSAIFHHTVRDI